MRFCQQAIARLIALTPPLQSAATPHILWCPAETAGDPLAQFIRFALESALTP
jgi:hypothetical protein